MKDAERKQKRKNENVKNKKEGSNDVAKRKKEKWKEGRV